MFQLAGIFKKLIFGTGALKKDRNRTWTKKKKKSNEQLSVGIWHYNHLLNKWTKVWTHATACVSVIPEWGSWRQEDQQFKANLGYTVRWGPSWSSRDAVSKGKPKMHAWMKEFLHANKNESVQYITYWYYRVHQGAIHLRRDYLKELGGELKSLPPSSPSACEEVSLHMSYPFHVLHGA